MDSSQDNNSDLNFSSELDLFLSNGKPQFFILGGEEENYLSRDTVSHHFEDLNNVKEELCHSTQFPATGNLPCLEEFAGQYDFKVKLNPSPNRSSWLYSKTLDLVFIDMGKILMVQFHLGSTPPGMRVRAVPVYSSADCISLPVLRCPVHNLEDDPYGKAHQQDGECFCLDYNMAGHVVRTSASQAIYCYDRFSERHSVVVPLTLPQPGSDFIEIPYSFKCKTSCSKGMQRRPIQLVFTLEDQNGTVVGRRVMSVKICSCPKRDKERMEKDVIPKFENCLERLSEDNYVMSPHRLKREGIITSEEREEKERENIIKRYVERMTEIGFKMLEELEQLKHRK